jgi:hypothetical protein
MAIMSPETQPGDPGLPEQSGQEVYRNLLETVEPEREPLPGAAYSDLAEQILRSQAYYRKKGVDTATEDARSELREIYLKEASDKRLQRFGEALIEAPEQLRLHGVLRALESGHQGPLQELGLSVGEAKNERIEFHHLLREVVMDGRESFDRVTLTRWLNDATDNQYPSFGRNELVGVISEVAAYDALADCPGVRSLRFGSVYDDAHGADIWFHYRDKLVSADVQFATASRQTEILGQRDGGKHVQMRLTVDSDEIDDMTITPEGVNRVRTITRGLLQQLS